MLDIEDPASPPDDDRSPLRRPGPPPTWRERLEHLADATGSTPARILGGAALAALAVAVGFWLLRPPEDPPESSLPYASTTVESSPSSASTAPALLVVHVAGAVAAPGLHELPAGSRVADAIAAAGGLTPQADAARINLAAPLTDGQRVYVLAVGEQEPAVAVGATDPGSGPTPSGPVNLNQADAEALDALPGVGPATAAAIIEHRGKIGAFTSVDQLLDVPGIGDAKLEVLRDLVTV